MKTHLNAGREPDLYFYRDENKAEVDLVDLTDPDRAFLAEIKSSQTYQVALLGTCMPLVMRLAYLVSDALLWSALKGISRQMVRW